MQGLKVSLLSPCLPHQYHQCPPNAPSRYSPALHTIDTVPEMLPPAQGLIMLLPAMVVIVLKPW